MQSPRLRTLNKFETLNQADQEILAAPELPQRPKAAKSKKSDNNNNNEKTRHHGAATTNGVAAEEEVAQTTTDEAEIFYSDEEFDVDAGATGAGVTFLSRSEANRWFLDAPFSINANMSYSQKRQVLLEGVPSSYNYRDMKNLLPTMVDFKLEDEESPTPTRAIAAFITVSDAKEALRMGQVYTKSDHAIIIKDLKTLQESNNGGATAPATTPATTPATATTTKRDVKKTSPSNVKEAETAEGKDALNNNEPRRSSPVDCTPIIVGPQSSPSSPFDPFNSYRFPIRPQLQPYQRPPFRMQRPTAPYGGFRGGPFGHGHPRGRQSGPWLPH